MSRWRPAHALCLVTDAALCGPRGVLAVVDAAVRGGVGMVQLREKTQDSRDFVERARALKALLAGRGVPLVINDRLDIALLCGADGVHVGQRDVSVDDVRRWLPDAIVGLSIESPMQLARVPAGVDYLGASPVFATATKADAAPALGLAGLAALKAATDLPLIAIGGIHAGNAAEVLRHGADGLAVVSAICAAEDPLTAAASLSACLAAQRQLSRPDRREDR
ncbi:thiamine phosphate synthase [Sphaerotilus mobilis]|uniref:Thiamine-phosphate synthase n=1 Tax=Sphaerotilus mobilis TaxID=47994 RepID=A0A4Q7LS69_9BURK|nr:thiamine phosphate synthase [Sphaerotilus mobilis]RZS57097.1 thiamine-phosphate pyrophosphorylase [Sphaerotilus mobilis]